MNERIFKFIQDNNTAYWLGFLAADGSIYENKLEIGLSQKDQSHLEKFKKFLNCDNTITLRNTRCGNNNKYYASCYISVKSWNLIKDLAQYQIIPNKSHQNIDFLNYIPEEYKVPFILGYFDGDGWFTQTENKSFGICGNESTVKSISSFLDNYFNWNPTNVHQYSKSLITFNFNLTANQKLFDFTNLYLSYQNNCDLLERKKLIAISIKEKTNNYLLAQKQKQENKIIKSKQPRIYTTKHICPVCKKEFLGRKEQIYCSQICVHKTQRVSDRPNREELKQLIRTMSFLQIGTKYGVSDNAIRKWCKAENLPYQKKVINSYSDEEWKNI